MFEILSVDFYDAKVGIKDYSEDPNVKRRNKVLNKLIVGGIILDPGCGDGISPMELMKTERIVYDLYIEFVPNFLKQIFGQIPIFTDSARYLFIKFRKVV